MGENIYKWSDCKGLIFKIYKQLNIKKKNDQKRSEDLNRYFSKYIQLAKSTWKNAQHH